MLQRYSDVGLFFFVCSYARFVVVDGDGSGKLSVLLFVHLKEFEVFLTKTIDNNYLSVVFDWSLRMFSRTNSSVIHFPLDVLLFRIHATGDGEVLESGRLKNISWRRASCCDWGRVTFWIWSIGMLGKIPLLRPKFWFSLFFVFNVFDRINFMKTFFMGQRVAAVRLVSCITSYPDSKCMVHIVQLWINNYVSAFFWRLSTYICIHLCWCFYIAGAKNRKHTIKSCYCTHFHCAGQRDKK